MRRRIGGPFTVRLLLVFGGAALVLEGSQAVDAGHISYENYYGQPVPSLVAYWVGWLLMLLGVLPKRIYVLIQGRLDRIK